MSTKNNARTVPTGHHLVTIAVPDQWLFRNIGGEPVYLDLTRVPDETMAEVAMGGVQIIMNNTFNSGGKDVAEGDRLARVLKRYDSWCRGEYMITERAASQATLMREAYVAEMLAKHPEATEKHITARMQETVRAALGKDTKATFDNFMQATAKAMADAGKGDAADLLAKITAKYERLAAELEASRQKAAKVQIDVTDMDLD